MTTWTDRTSPSTSWDDVQFGGSGLTWTQCSTKGLEWNDMDVVWAALASTSWTNRTSPSTSWT